MSPESTNEPDNILNPPLLLLAALDITTPIFAAAVHPKSLA
jgi:hypothetical protein